MLNFTKLTRSGATELRQHGFLSSGSRFVRNICMAPPPRPRKEMDFRKAEVPQYLAMLLSLEIGMHLWHVAIPETNVRKNETAVIHE